VGPKRGGWEFFMTYKLTFEQKPAYLHVTVTGWNSKETAAQYVQEVLAECIARNSFRLLIEERLEGPRLPLLDVFEIVADVSKKALDRLQAVGYVDVNAKGDMMKFAQTVALNRALPLKVFSTVAEAEKWLLSEESRGPGPSSPVR
jgi:hypothetical protein